MMLMFFLVSSHIKTKKSKMIRLWKLTNKLNERAYYQELLKEQKLASDL